MYIRCKPKHDTMSNKTDREAMIFEWFLDAFKEAPITNVVHKDAPDFRFEFCDKNVGLEVTEIYQDADVNGSLLKQRSSDGAKFTEEIIHHLQRYIPFTFGIGIVFNYQHPIGSANRISVQEKVLMACLPVLRMLENKQNARMGWHDELPVEISRIYLTRHEGLPAPYNKMPETAMPPDLTDFHLQTVVDGKDSKLHKYSPCDEYWLLISEGDYCAGAFDDLELEQNIVTKFDRVYLLRTKTRKLICLT
jgi:hypothetical protein